MNGSGRAGIVLLIGLVSAAPFGLAATQKQSGRPEQDKAERFYEDGNAQMDDGEWEAAVRSFNKVIELEGRQSDAARYWKAYSLRKLARLPEALGSIEELRRVNPRSPWLDDARALEMEIRHSKGSNASPEKENDDEMKLVAINALGNVDPERAIPMLEKLLRTGTSSRLREQALFVLVQIGTQRSREILYDIARGRSHPDLQRKALEFLGMFGIEDARPLLKEILGSTADPTTRRAVLNAYMTSGDTESLYAVAKSEKDEEMRRQAINLLGAQGAKRELMELYKAESSIEVRVKILEAFGICACSDELIDVARNERDSRLRRAAIHGLAIGGGRQAGDVLVSIYSSDKDFEVRKAVLDALMVQSNDTALIAIARKETNPELKKIAVERLSVMGTRAATDYMLQILND